MIGHDYYAPVLPYRSQEQLTFRLNGLGFASHEDYIASIFPEIPPINARPGDLALTPDTALGLFQGPSLYQMSPSGLGLTPRSCAVRAFMV